MVEIDTAEKRSTPERPMVESEDDFKSPQYNVKTQNV
jgi:hypothetical protein